MTKFIFALLSAVLCGCASPRTFVQPAAAVDRDKSALVTCESEHGHTVLQGLNQKVFIAAIDNKSTFTMNGFLTDTAPYAESAYVTPGRHYLTLQYNHMNVYARAIVWFDANAGESYLVRRRIEGYSVMFWVEEANTGKIVGGIPGGEPEKQSRPAPRPQRL